MTPQTQTDKPDAVVIGYVKRDTRGKLYVVIPRAFESALPEKTAVRITKVE